MKNIVFKTAGVQGVLKETLSKIKKISIAFIYGSFASKKENPESDIDLMIIGDPDMSVLNEKISILEKKLKREINFAIYSLEEYKDRKKEKAAFILELKKKPKIMLIGNESEI